MNYNPYPYPYPYQMYNQFRLSSTDELNEGLYKWVKLTFTNGTEKEAFIFYLDKQSGAVFILSFPQLTTSQANVNDIKSFEVMPEPPKMEEEAPQESEVQNGGTEGDQEVGQMPGMGQPEEMQGDQESPFGQMPGMGQSGEMQGGQESPFGQMPGMGQSEEMQGGQESPFGQIPGMGQPGGMQSGQGSPFGQMPGMGQPGGMQGSQGSPFGQMPGMGQPGGMQDGQGSPFGQIPGGDQSGIPFGGQRYQQWNQPVYYNPYSYYWQQ
ncbi:hypothetical protein LIT32_21605 [Bacillus sp. CMF21]|uniref:hypothetical protein n=1 Tax=Metabacillus dongyingensis TaxID=2874282 RepID=UPI001CC0F673|nr:hypothetical protein [Metabacillus dongyingensis]UAL51705.1 hypothetical protein K8L98_21435 [Metabacillus dongyingensis]USK28012.1 hypothetical protein LIT32_21605 [Bacillus sp. CMF21]